MQFPSPRIAISISRECNFHLATRGNAISIPQLAGMQFPSRDSRERNFHPATRGNAISIPQLAGSKIASCNLQTRQLRDASCNSKLSCWQLHSRNFCGKMAVWVCNVRKSKGEGRVEVPYLGSKDRFDKFYSMKCFVGIRFWRFTLSPIFECARVTFVLIKHTKLIKRGTHFANMKPLSVISGIIERRRVSCWATSALGRWGATLERFSLLFVFISWEFAF